MMSDIGLSLRLLWRDWRAGELTLLLVALVVAIGTVTTIAIFTDRLQQALERDSATFLAADRVIESRDPLPDTLLADIAELPLAEAVTLSFATIVFSDDETHLAAIKAVSDGYPLRGTLTVADAPFAPGTPAQAVPAPGEVWVESRLLPLLGIGIGDRLDIGFASFTVGRVLVDEPDRGSGFSSFAGPRVLMNLADVAATEVVQPGSRQTYRYLFAGETDALDALASTASSRLPVGARLISVRESSEEIGDTLQRAERFLLLGGLLGVVLAGIAIALSARRYSLRHYDHVAILKTLGARPSTIDRLFVILFLLLGVIAGTLGAVIGWLVQFGITEVLRPLFELDLPAPGPRPLALGLGTGFICLIAFAVPPLLQLRAIQPVRIIRRDLAGQGRAVTALAYAAGGAGILALMWWYSGSLFLTLVTLAGGGAVVLAFAVVATLLLRSGRVLGMQAGSVWRLAFAGMRQHGVQTTTQILAFGLAIMLLLIVYLIRTALIGEWQAQIPPGAPNHFAFNITENQAATVRALLVEDGVETQPFFALVAGNIDSVDKASNEPWESSGDDRGPDLASSLTAIADLPRGNVVVDGSWWPADYDGPPLLSVEAEYAERQRLVLGDRVTFTAAGRAITATVSSIRTVEWENLRPNFFMILSPGALEGFPAMQMTSFHLAPDQKLLLNALLRAHPTITVIEVDALIEQIRTIVDRVTLAIELVLLQILASGALVLVASVQASMDERMRQHAVLRTLGAGRRLIMGSLAIEFLTLGLMAGLLASLGAELTAYLLETQIFELDYTVNVGILAAGPVVGALLVGALGLLATNRLVRTPPTTILRESV